jgi:hypothetical protein
MSSIEFVGCELDSLLLLVGGDFNSGSIFEEESWPYWFDVEPTLNSADAVSRRIQISWFIATNQGVRSFDTKNALLSLCYKSYTYIYM